MEIWLNANISPAIASWIRKDFCYRCFSLREIDLRNASDMIIFKKAKIKGNITLITKDQDFCSLLQFKGTSKNNLVIIRKLLK